MKYQTFISLGPSCASAGILKWSNLRRFSYPLDWSRSGSWHLEDLFNLTPEEYYIKHISTPNIQLKPKSPPGPDNHFTSSLIVPEQIYGYNYFFNPHKTPSALKSYSIRCLKRLSLALSRNDVYLNFLMAVDGNIGTREESLDKPELIGSFISQVISTYVSPKRFGVSLCLCLTHDYAYVAYEQTQLSQNVRYVSLLLPNALNGAAHYRDSIAGKILYPKEMVARYQILASL